MKVQPYQLAQRQSLDMEMKVVMSQRRIAAWYNHFRGDVCVSFSGGKDSTVMLHLVRQQFPDVPAVFVDTGLEYPEIRSFVKTVPNVIWVKPTMTFTRVIEHYGFPVVSKEVSQKIAEVRTTNSDKLRAKRMGDGAGSIPKKWRFLIDAPFKISPSCCRVMKKNPAKQCPNPFVGIMADDSELRKQTYYKYGCNAFELKAPQSRPIAAWLEKDIWEYIRSRQLSYSPIYDMGYKMTGCMFCAFGLHLEKSPNRFDRMKMTHPKQYRYCMDVLGLRDVLRYVRSGMQSELFAGAL